MTKPGFLPLVYVPYLSNEERGANVVARTDGPPERLIAPIRQTVQKAAPALTIWRLEPLEATLRRNYWKSQFYGTLFLSFAGVALLLAATGLYAVMALEVSRRQQEIGVRIAVGGSAGAVFGLVLRQAMMPVVAGLVAGLALALDTNRVLQGQLVQVSPNDPLTMVLAALALLAAALVGCVVPACRAIGIDPTIALRNE
jgi:ABC-type antimicrobial peptide transport system permease subunit